jgi:hypothetical protein
MLPDTLPYLAPAPASLLDTAQTATMRAKLGKRAAFKASVTVTPAGLLSIGGLVAAVLLSVPPIIRAARR